jgi:hypothetical protein
MGDRGVLLAPGPGLSLAALCDCGVATTLALLPVHDGRPIPRGTPLGPPAAQEVAYTCTGCGTAHWLTIAPQPDGNIAVTAQRPGRHQHPPRRVVSWTDGWYTLPQ